MRQSKTSAMTLAGAAGNSLAAQTARAEEFYSLAMACIHCTTEHEFQTLVRIHVRPLLPHGLLIAVIGRIDQEHMEMTTTIGVDYPESALRLLPKSLNLRERPVVQRWLSSREPMVLQLPADAQLMSDRERQEIESFELGRLAINGVVDLAARTGSYFSFGRVPEDADRATLLGALKLVTPLLHQALMSVHRSRAEPKQVLPSDLTATERELLKWVVAGRSNREIAQLRGRSVATIRNQLHSIYGKYGASRRTELVRILLNEQ